MYGLPKNFDGSFLIGHVLEMVCFNASQVYLHFDKQVTITIEGDFSYQITTSSVALEKLRAPVAQSNIMQLLGHSIANISGDVEGTLTLVFDNGQIIKCYDSSTRYESYQIKFGQQTIIV